MTRYRSGVAKERDTVARLRAAGYRARRTPGSKGLFDVIGALDDRHWRLVQVKYTAAPRGRSWVDANVRRFAAERFPPFTLRECWVYRRGTARPEVYRLINGEWHPWEVPSEAA